MQARLGTGSVAWWNDDLPDLSLDVTLDECMRQAASAGYSGMETGNRFPMSMDQLGPILNRHGMSICGGWFSGELLDGDLEREKDRISGQLAFFMAAGTDCINYGETARSIQGRRDAPLNAKPRISEPELAAYGRKISDFADWCAGQGLPLSYHHHMGAVVQTEAEIDLLMKHSSVPLLLDTGHLALTGADILRVIANHHARINHVHAKDIRRGVVEALDHERHNFLDAVIKGAFTVPGDGDLDFDLIVRTLAECGYEGWFIVEAEQDPSVSPPLEMAEKGCNEMLRLMAAAGYEVVQ